VITTDYPSPRTSLGLDVSRCGPSKQVCAENEGRTVALEDERAIREVVERCLVVSLFPRSGSDTLNVELRVDRVGSSPAGVELRPQRGEAAVVLSATKCARAVARGEGGRLVEQEELREAAWLQQRPTLPAAELELAGDPALAGIAPPDAPGLVVQAAAIPVDEAAPRVRD
jgi:hypothetical protein